MNSGLVSVTFRKLTPARIAGLVAEAGERETGYLNTQEDTS